MKQASFIAPASILAALLVGAIGIYLYDALRDDLIADGVKVGGVDVGGMRAGEAREALNRQLAAPLRRSIRVKARRQVVKLSPRRARVRADVEAMVQDALSESREGNLITRSLQALGGSSSAELPARVTYSRRSLGSFVKRVKRDLDRPAQDAKANPSSTGLNIQRAQTGVEVEGRQLRRAIAAELVLPHGKRVVRARTEVTKPEVTTNELELEYRYFITVSRSQKVLRFFRNLKLVGRYRIAVGTIGFDTPSGLYNIQNKGINVAWQAPKWAGRLAGKTIPGGAPNNPLKARWLGFYDGAGIHGTNDLASLGTAASHGCIRMSIPEVKELYDRVPVRTPVYIG